MGKEKPKRVTKGRLLPLQRLRRAFGKQGKQFIKTVRKPKREELDKAKSGAKTEKNQPKEPANSVQVFGRKKNCTAVAHCKQGFGVIKVNGAPLQYVEPPTLRLKLYEPILLLGKDKFANVNIRVRVRGGGPVARIYAVRQAISKSLIAYYQKYVDEVSKKEIKDILHNYDKQLLVADSRRTEPKKYGGPGARARYQKSYR